MKRWLPLLLAVLFMGGARAESSAGARFIGTWAAENVVVDIALEDGEIQCSAIFDSADGGTDTWEYSGCWYDAADGALWCGSVVRTHEVFDAQKGEAVETEWSMNDMIFASFKFAESGGALIWTDDALEAPLGLERAEDAPEDEPTV